MDADSQIQGFAERLDGALSEERQHRYRNAVELYYKAIVHIIDYLLLMGPKELVVDNLKQRLEEIRKLDKEIANIFNEDHLFYRGTYKTKKTIQDCGKLKNDVKTIAKLSGIKSFVQKSIEKIS